MHKWIIYMYTFPNGMKYVGATTQTLRGRQGMNFQRYANCSSIWPAIQEFGTDSIDQTILYEGYIDDHEAAELEQRYIQKYQTITHGYNRGIGGEGLVKTYSDDVLEYKATQMRDIGLSHRGTHPSEETRRRQSEARIGRHFGPMSEETKIKIGIANSRENMSEETRQRRHDSKIQPVRATDPNTGEQLFFNSQEETAEYFGVRDSAVARWINGTRNPSNGYKFENYSPTTTE